MNNFHWESNRLFCENVPLSDLAGEYGTPSFIYSTAAICNRIELLQGALESFDCTICFSVKSNSNLSILQCAASRGIGADIVSGGELFRALKAGIPPGSIVFSGVGKTVRELEYALASSIRMFNVESESELHLLSSIAERMGKIAPVALRINPDVDARTHQFTTTGKKGNKFGIPFTDVERIYTYATELPNIQPLGIDVHLGSPITSLEPYREALDVLSGLIINLRANGIAIETLDLGGGFGITYSDEKPFTPVQFADLIRPYIDKLDCRLIVEPGRYIMGNSAVLLTRITYVKKSYGKTFYICDAGMNDCIRPPLYDAYHAITPVEKTGTAPAEPVDIVGPICESSDFLAKGREMPVAHAGDILAVMSCGAYCFTMASNYNSRPRACEILVNGDSSRVIRERETWEDLVRGESLPGTG
ncbi:MAG: diaminopimelate decarboxylase [Chitinivibrionales bacterium]|nr:diaminopimelate decarboxylase [Chitinivibrionales bacterium]